MNDADQHLVLQKGNAQSLSNSRTHVNIAFISRHKNSIFEIYSVFSGRSAALLICDM